MALAERRERARGRRWFRRRERAGAGLAMGASLSKGGDRKAGAGQARAGLVGWHGRFGRRASRATGADRAAGAGRGEPCFEAVRAGHRRVWPGDSDTGGSDG